MRFDRIIIFVLLAIMVAVSVYASQNTIQGKHAEAEMGCIDCHATDKPEKRANWKICMECHGDMSDNTEILTFKDKDGVSYTAVIHSPHAGQIKCTDCHASHKKSSLFCNKECHNFIIKVP